MAGTATKLGPGELTIGATAPDMLDLSCQLSAAMVEWSKDKEDDVLVFDGRSYQRYFEAPEEFSDIVEIEQ